MNLENFKIYKPERYLMKILLFLFIITDIGFTQTITFQKTIVGPSIEYFWSVVQTPDNGYIAVGRKRVSSFDYMYIVRFNPYGDTVWTKTMIGNDATCVIKTNDNNYAICGLVGTFVKFDISGNILNQGTFYNEGSSINTLIQLSDNNYFMCGRDFTSPGYPYVIKFDSFGNFLWDSTYTDGIYTGFFSDMTLSLNSIVLTGSYSPVSPITQNIFIMKLSFEGQKVFFNSGYPESYLHPASIAETQTGNFVICGSYRDNDCFLAKYRIDGTFEWIKSYDTTILGGGKSITIGADGNYVCASVLNTTSEFVRIRNTDTNGVEVWSRLHSIKDHNQVPLDIKMTSDSGFIIGGVAAPVTTSQGDIYLLKTDKNGSLLPPIGIEPVNGILPDTYSLYQNYPNPFNPETI
ncbi:MAG: hypothetical protein K8I03_04875, partial [Ignavibacteria bacterium]|nr:hypothetical protein [Ignavibacteria bacterium]